MVNKKILIRQSFLFLLLLFFSISGKCQDLEIPLQKGYNLISLSLPAANTLIEKVLSSISGKYRDVWEYDSENSLDPWKHYHPQFSSFSDLKEIRLNKKYWIYALQDTVLVIEELDTTPPDGTIIINNGSNYTDSQTVTLTLTGPDAKEMKFSNDNITWSEAESFSTTKQWTLSSGDGVKTVCVSLKDSSDNWSKPICAVITLNTGTLIGPDGGEITSPDGKVTIIIPAGALTENVRISILTIDNPPFIDLQPTGTTMLRAVECLPYGLVFNISATMIYRLDEAEVPGTSVQLVLYNAVTNQITKDAVSHVLPNGYDVQFPLSHFSTYAALKNLISSGAPIGGGVQIPLPDMLTGAFGHAIPISIAPGRKGMQPNLGLSYRSSNGNSWVGIGFNLNPGHIIRSTRLGPPSYNDTQDTFYFVTDGGTTELVHLVDNLYQAKIESSFTKFYKQPGDYWKVVSKDGSIVKLGENNNAKETSAKGTYSWYITKAIDTNGNYIQYEYTQDQGKTYLSRILYTGNENGTAPKDTVDFFLESREDIASSYISTSRIATAKRLKEIQVKVDGDLLWTYRLEYAYSPDTNRSLLKYVRQYANDDKQLPVQGFKYQGNL